MLVMLIKPRILVIQTLIIFFQVACVSPGGGIGESERLFQQEQKNKLLDRMSLDQIFLTDLSKKLARAAGRGDVEGVKKLIEKNTDVNFKGKSNGTALYWAFRQRNLKGFEYLLIQGADPNVEFGDGGTIVNRIASGDTNDFLRLALQHGGDVKSQEVSPLDNAISVNCERNCREAAELLLDAGADINGLVRGGIPVLNSAVRRGNFDIAYDLLSRGADPYQRREIDRSNTVEDFDDKKFPSKNQLSIYQIKWLEKFSALLDAKRK